MGHYGFYFSCSTVSLPNSSPLQEVPVPVIGNRQCSCDYLNVQDADITSNMICAGQENRGVCQVKTNLTVIEVELHWKLFISTWMLSNTFYPTWTKLCSQENVIVWVPPQGSVFIWDFSFLFANAGWLRWAAAMQTRLSVDPSWYNQLWNTLCHRHLPRSLCPSVWVPRVDHHSSEHDGS